jgi:hypothetical protein
MLTKCLCNDFFQIYQINIWTLWDYIVKRKH